MKNLLLGEQILFFPLRDVAQQGSKNAKLILLKIYPFSLSTDRNLLKPVLPGLLLATLLKQMIFLISPSWWCISRAIKHNHNTDDLCPQITVLKTIISILMHFFIHSPLICSTFHNVNSDLTNEN